MVIGHKQIRKIFPWSWASEGRGKGTPWILKCSAKKGCFFSFEWEKTHFATFAMAPQEKILPTPMSVTLLRFCAEYIGL